MSNLSGYPTRSFKESQKFLVQDPSTGTASLVLGSDLVDYITPRLNSVIAETTRVAAENTDYDVGEVIQTTGATSPGDNFAATYLVVEGGTGDFPMLNGNDLLVIKGDELLREQLISNDAGEGSELVTYTGNSQTVTEALDDRVIRKETIAQIEALTPTEDFQVSLSGTRAGVFEFDSSDLSTEVTADTQQGIYIAPSSDPTGASGAWVRVLSFKGKLEGILVNWFGAVGDGSTEDTTALQAAFDFGASVISFPEGIYLSDNLTLKNKRQSLLGGGSGVAIKAKTPLSDTSYFIATEGWINNSTTADNPVTMSGLTIQVDGQATDGVILRTFFSEVDRCTINGTTTGSCLYFSEVSKDGSTIPSSTMVENSVTHCRISGDGTNGIGIRFGTAANKTTDAIIQNNFVFDFNIGILSTASAGAIITNNHTYANSTAGIDIRRAAISTIVSNNYLEDAFQMIGNVNDDPIQIGPGNTFLKRVDLQYGASAQLITVTGNLFNGTADVYHNGNAGGRDLYIVGNTFETSTPLVIAGAFGEIVQKANYSVGLGRVVEGQVTAATPNPSFTDSETSPLVISGGVITVNSKFHRVDTESAAATDDLDTINGGIDGLEVTFKAENFARAVVFKDATGNMRLNGDFSLDSVADTITLIYDNSLALWVEVARSNNA